MRRDTASNWTSTNPTLAQWEIGYETDTKKIKIGDGSTAWTTLRYYDDPRVYSTTSLATLTPESSTYDVFHLTAQAVALNIANHVTSTPADGKLIRVRILDNGTARAITYGTNYVAKWWVALPSTTVISKNTEMLFEWNANLAKYNLLAVAQEA